MVSADESLHADLTRQPGHFAAQRSTHRLPAIDDIEGEGIRALPTGPGCGSPWPAAGSTGT